MTPQKIGEGVVRNASTMSTISSCQSSPRHRLNLTWYFVSKLLYLDFRNDPSLPAEQDKIRLRLTTCADVLAESTNTNDLIRARIENLFTFIINVAYSNDLSTTPAVQFLQDALSILRRGGDFSRNAKINWRERLSQLSIPSKV